MDHLEQARKEVACLKTNLYRLRDHYFKFCTSISTKCVVPEVFSSSFPRSKPSLVRDTLRQSNLPANRIEGRDDIAQEGVSPAESF
jgi:hypothetical protein